MTRHTPCSAYLSLFPLVTFPKPGCQHASRRRLRIGASQPASPAWPVAPGCAVRKRNLASPADLSQLLPPARWRSSCVKFMHHASHCSRTGSSQSVTNTLQHQTPCIPFFAASDSPAHDTHMHIVLPDTYTFRIHHAVSGPIKNGFVFIVFYPLNADLSAPRPACILLPSSHSPGLACQQRNRRDRPGS